MWGAIFEIVLLVLKPLMSWIGVKSAEKKAKNDNYNEFVDNAQNQGSTASSVYEEIDIQLEKFEKEKQKETE